MRACPALFISAPASHQGKTTVTAALARHHARLGRRVRVFKTGPDFLDPMILERASGSPVYSLHLWMVGVDGMPGAARRRPPRDADLILIEGVMGLFDGTPSSADLAATFGVPVLAVIGAHGMAQTFGALAFGLARYRPEVPFHGVLANRVASARHAQMFERSHSRRLALLRPLVERRCYRAARSSSRPDAGSGNRRPRRASGSRRRRASARLRCATCRPPCSSRTQAPVRPPRLLEGVHIAIARDAAFSFIYPANVDLLQAMGARISTFSPLADEPVPDA